VEELAREVLGEAVQELKDPRIGFVTVTSVKLTPDLRVARVFVSALGSEKDRRTSIAGVAHAAPHLRSVLGREVRMRHLPRLEIVEDQTAEHGDRIEQLLRGVAAPLDAQDADHPEEVQE